MRHFLITTLLLSLVAGCSSVNIGPHRIDVQQGNALDQENVARLKPGLSRSQVRFLLGTPLVVDPFRTDRWDYVYLFYKAGKLAEQKRITLFFEGDTLARIEGELPAAESLVSPVSKAATPAAQPVAKAGPAPLAAQSAAPQTSIVPPLSSPQSVSAYADPRPSGELSLQPETDVAKIQPDVVPDFPGTSPAAAASDAVLVKALNEWAEAWARRDYATYFAAYDDSFVPEGGVSRADWERRKRQVLDASQGLDIKIDSPSVGRDEEGAAVVKFNQHYRSDRYSDAVVKQLRMVERDGRWLIVEEKVLSVLRGVQP